jgi:hypothetical protein
VPINWLSLRNIKWTDTFYDAMYQALQPGQTTSKKDRLGTARRLNCKRFWEYAHHLSLQNDRIALVDNNLPPWLTDADGKAIAEVTLPIVYTVIKQSEIHTYLQQMYSNPANNAYRASNSFYKRVSSQTLGISRTDVEKFVASQEVHQIQANIFSKKQGLIVKPLRPTSVMQWWQVDLIDVAKFAGSNNGTHFVMVVIDIFSKYCYARPLRSKHGNRIAFELQLVFLQDGSPTVLQHDNGSEFVNSDMAELTKRWGIEVRRSLPYRSENTSTWFACLHEWLRSLLYLCIICAHITVL